MNNHSIKYYIVACLLVLGIFFSSFCNNRKQNREKEEKLQGFENVDTGLNDDTSKSYKRILNMLGLEDIKSGYSEEYLRIWMNYALSDSSKVIEISGTGVERKGKILYFKYHYNGNGQIDSIGKYSQHSIPISGWENFEKQLKKTGVDMLKDPDNIEGYESCMDGDGLIFERVAAGRYTKISYPCYEVYDSLTDIKKVKDILMLIQKEFGFRLFPHPPI